MGNCQPQGNSGDKTWCLARKDAVWGSSKHIKAHVGFSSALEPWERMMQDYESHGEHQPITRAGASATHTAPAPGSGLHLWNSKQNKLRTLQKIPSQDRPWKVLAFMERSKPSFSRQEEWQSAALVRGLALFFPLSLNGRGKKEEKKKKKEKQQRTAETQLTFLAKRPCLNHWMVTMNEMPVPCLINTSFLWG